MTTIDGTAFDEYWRALESGDSGRATLVAVGELDAGVPTLDVLENLVAAGQAEVGRRWAANDWNVAQEHRATSVSEEVVAAVAGRLPVAPADGPMALVTCCDGEWHSLPSRILAAALRSARWRVTFLGASVPARHLAHLLHELGPDVTAVSCALPPRLFDARELIEVSRGAGVPVVVGGRGFGADGRWARTLGADAWAPDARHALAVLAELPPFTTPAPPLAAPEDEIGALRRRVRGIVDDSVERMAAALPDVARYDPAQRRRTEEDVAHIVEFLCAARFVGDVGLFTEFVTWLRDILVARGVPAATLAAGLRVVAAVVGAEAGPFGPAIEYLQAGAAVAER